MKHEITPFNYNGRNLSTITDDHGEVWFIAKDVCAVLDHSNVSVALSGLDEDERSKFKLGRQGEVNVVNESGLYSLILNSRKPEAKPFKKWVTSEVLPAIRKTGKYEAPVKPKEQTSLDKLRMASALEKAESVAARICERFNRLGDSGQQVIFAKIINPIVGDEVIMLPSVSERLLSAGKVGEAIGVSGNMIGRLANKHGLKTEEFGEFRLDKSAYSDKQVETFHYNAKAVAKLRELCGEEVAA